MPELMQLSDTAFETRWRGMTDQERSALPEEERHAAFTRYRKLNNHVEKSIENMRREQAKNKPTDPHPWPSPLEIASLAGAEPAPPQFIVPDWLPSGYATLLAGHGGVGKSAIGLHLAACIAVGKPFAGIEVGMRRVLYLSCEDRAGVLRWRLYRICRHLEIDPEELAGLLDVVELVGHDSILWERDPRTGGTLTPAYRRLTERARSSRADVLIVDGISDTYGGNENARGEVKRYVNALVGLVAADHGAVLLVGHVAKPTAATNTGEGYSGSTSWHNSCRARWYLYPETQPGEDGTRPERSGRLLLELQKSNHGQIDQAIGWRWDPDQHMFTPEPAQTAFDRKHQDREEQAAIRRALKGCMDASIHVPAALQGPRTAYLALSHRAEFPTSLKGGGRAKTARFRRQLEALRHIRHIEESSYRRENRHIVATLVLTTEGRAECV